MATSNPTNNPNMATADDAAIQDLPESKDSTAVTPDEAKNVMGGVTPIGAAAANTGGGASLMPGTDIGEIDVVVKKKPSGSGR
jgi:hypothetical protein